MRLLIAGQLVLAVIVCVTVMQEALSRRDPVTLNVPSFRGSDSGEVVALDEDGKQRWKQQWSQAIRETENGTLVLFHESGEGTHSPFQEDVSWEVTSVWERGARFRPREMEREFYSLGRKLLQKETMVLDWERGTAEFVRTLPEKDVSERKTFEIPPDTLIVSGIASALRGFPFDSGETVRAHLLTNEPHLYEIEIEDKGLDEVSVPAGTFESYRLKLNVDLGLLNLFRTFLPDTYFWFDASRPHPWLRYEGLEGGRGTPKIEMRLVEMGPKVDSAEVRVNENRIPGPRARNDAREEGQKNSSNSRSAAVRK